MGSQAITLLNNLNSILNFLPGGEFTKRITLPHNMLCLIFLIFILTIIIFKYTLLQFFETLLCKMCLVASVEEVDKKNGLNEVLSISDLFKIFDLKKKQLKKIEKMKIEAPNMKAYLDSIIQYDMSAILKKLKQFKIKNLDEIKKDFDKFNDLLLEFPVEENKLSGDITYYLGVISICLF